MDCPIHACSCVSSMMPFFVLIAILDLIIKGFALWRAAQSGQKVWFVVLLILNTAGLLPLLYLFVINKKKLST